MLVSIIGRTGLLDYTGVQGWNNRAASAAVRLGQRALVRTNGKTNLKKKKKKN